MLITTRSICRKWNDGHSIKKNIRQKCFPGKPRSLKSILLCNNFYGYLCIYCTWGSMLGYGRVLGKGFWPPYLNNANLIKSYNYCKVRKYASPRKQKLSLAPWNFFLIRSVGCNVINQKIGRYLVHIGKVKWKSQHGNWTKF